MQETIQFVQITVADLTTLIQQTVADEITKVINLIPKKEESGDPDLLTRRETKELLGKSYPYLWRLNRQGILKSRKMGRSVYYYKQDIFDHLNKSQSKLSA